MASLYLSDSMSFIRRCNWSIVTRVSPKFRSVIAVEFGGQFTEHSASALSGTTGSFGNSAGAPGIRMMSEAVAQMTSLRPR
ncbi:MAG: hypothetical protein BWY59_00025 [Verrucomicrobia bacterium ADurb.Bin345]|nr:MAG: hypothetical protein BWY59_00025 [Verrucomicrobia bacterium ADurb.Bin345]